MPFPLAPRDVIKPPHKQRVPRPQIVQTRNPLRPILYPARLAPIHKHTLRTSHDVRVDEIGISLRHQIITAHSTKNTN